jgi:hypothetical protein
VHNNIILDIILKGHTHFNSKEDFEYLIGVIEKIEWIQDKEENYRYIKDSTEINSALISTMKLLGEKYVSIIDNDYKLGYNSIWNGTEISSCEWHNDLKEGPNLFFLLYYTDINEGCGGEIEFRRSETKQITGSITPKKYDVVMGSQELQWEHRVGHFKCPGMERITANFGFYVNYGFNNQTH